jgi:archaemetzincin
MIRLATFDELDPKLVKDLCKVLYQAFAVGAEHSGTVPVPGGTNDPLDAHKILAEAPKVAAFQDDKILFLTTRKLLPRKLLTGEVPTLGLSQYNAQHCVVSIAHIKTPGENVKTVARYALQELGPCWGLHHCLDPRCSMYPHWTPSYPAGDASFCVFCRETSEQKIRLAKS